MSTIKKINIQVKPHQPARASDFNATTAKVDELVDALNAISGGTPHYYIMDDCLDPMIAMGEEKQYNFSLIDARGFDMTDRVTGWKIRRETADTVADDLWACKAKVKAFAGSIGLTWSSDPTLNDMDPNETVNTTNFRITAYIDDVPVAEELIML